MAKHFQILIVGGGNAGISTAAVLLNKQKTLNIGIIEPSDKHYYQPAWTLVGGGDFDIAKTVRDEASVIPSGAEWVKDKAIGFNPAQNSVQTLANGDITYDYLIVAPGIQLDWHKIEGLKETLGKNQVTSNYLFQLAPYTWEAAQKVKPGDKVLFTSPDTPVKCGGAPQKIMYLLSDYFSKKGIINNLDIHFYSGGSMIFGVKKYADTLNKVLKRYGIKTHFKHKLVKIDGEAQRAWFEDADGNTLEEQFDFIHITPPQSAPDFVKSSDLAVAGNALGWIDVNKHTLQHNKYPNVFACGDATSTPNAKTGAAIRKQVSVLVHNLMNQMRGEALDAEYNGYGSCPLITGYGKLVLAEFDYNNNPTETFPFDQSEERWTMYQLKKQVLPWMYWNMILSGNA